MARVIFYEKPGCGTNAKQKAWLASAGHEIVARDLLRTAWTPASLRPFFGGLPVPDWFNRNAPRVKAGEVIPERFGEAGALAAMVDDPLLIRRPLIDIAGVHFCGFVPRQLGALIPLPLEPFGAGEQCSGGGVPCPEPAS